MSVSAASASAVVPPAAAAAASSVAVAPAWFHSSSSTFVPAPLLSLLGASKPDQVESLLGAVFRARNEGVAVAKRDRVAQEFGINQQEADALLLSLSHLIHSFLYHGYDTKEAVFSLFPSDFHPSLRSLLTKLLLQRMPEWRETLLQGAIGPAKLVEFDWRVDVKSASNHLSHMAVPTVLVDMKLQPPPTSTRLIAPLESFNFELTPAALATLLNGLERIQTQLSATSRQ